MSLPCTPASFRWEGWPPPTTIWMVRFRSGCYELLTNKAEAQRLLVSNPDAVGLYDCRYPGPNTSESSWRFRTNCKTWVNIPEEL